MSSRSWLSYYYQNRFHLTPLSYESLEYASGFSSEQCPEGIVAISTNTLRILALEKLGAVFNQVCMQMYVLFHRTWLVALLHCYIALNGFL
jgi:splicing factor 3B subunit 3